MAISCSGGCGPWREEAAEAWRGWIGWRWGNAEPGAWRCGDGDTSCQPPSLASPNTQWLGLHTSLGSRDGPARARVDLASLWEILPNTCLRNRKDTWPSLTLSHNFLYFFVFLEFRAGGKNYTGGKKWSEHTWNRVLQVGFREGMTVWLLSSRQ